MTFSVLPLLLAAVARAASLTSVPVLELPTETVGVAPVISAPLPLELGAVDAQPLTAALSPVSLPAVRLSIDADLRSIQRPSFGGAGARVAADRVLATALGRRSPSVAVLDLPSLDAAPSGKGSRSKPAVEGVRFDDAVPAAHRAILNESLRRRKAGWIRGLAQVGVKLEGPIAPEITVRSSKEVLKRGTQELDRVIFHADWTQTEMNVGAFRVSIPLKNHEPELSRSSPPPTPVEKQLKLRFKKTTLEPLGENARVEVEVTESRIQEFLEKRKLRLLGRDWTGFYTVAVTGKDQADAVARELNGSGLVLFATPSSFVAAEADEIHVRFKKTTVIGGDIAIETTVREDGIGEFLRDEGLRVVELDRDGLYRVAGTSGESAAVLAAKLANDPRVLYASPRVDDSAEDRQVILSFKKSYIVDGLFESSVSDDDVARTLGENGLTVVSDLGDGRYKVAGPASGGELAARLKDLPVVLSVVAVGTLPEDAVRASAKGAAHYKGGTWSATEFNIYDHEYRFGLVLAGATKAQLALYDELLSAAPVIGGRFNPYSGD